MKKIHTNTILSVVILCKIQYNLGRTFYFYVQTLVAVVTKVFCSQRKGNRMSTNQFGHNLFISALSLFNIIISAFFLFGTDVQRIEKVFLYMALLATGVVNLAICGPRTIGLIQTGIPKRVEYIQVGFGAITFFLILFFGFQ